MYQDHQASVSPQGRPKVERAPLGGRAPHAVGNRGGHFAVKSHLHAVPLHAIAPLRVGMLGLGTVGMGTYTVLRRNAELIAARTGRPIEIAMVAVRNLARAARLVDDEDVELVDDPFLVVNHPGIDVVVEVIGGTTTARDLVLQAIAGVDLNLEQLMADMNSPEVAQRMEQDRNDAVALKVTATPEYFVNGRPMPSFGQQQLLTLVSEALQGAY